ncbi:MAG TPA: hypothetical protein VH164_18085, partial [Ktedonobacteraceae bacterium]|nr:hypothetical protein [Ktedonobacteraceae bacterium]
MASHFHEVKQGTSRVWKTALVFGMASLLMLVAACGGGPATTRSSTPLRVVSSPGQLNPDFFNPYYSTNQGGDWGAQGLLYESLYFTNLYTGDTSPWLASSYAYNSDNTQLTF